MQTSLVKVVLVLYIRYVRFWYAHMHLKRWFWCFLYFLEGEVIRWGRSCYQETINSIRARISWVQERSYAYCQTSTHKSCSADRMLHREGRENVDLRIHAQQEPWLLPLRWAFFLFKKLRFCRNLSETVSPTLLCRPIEEKRSWLDSTVHDHGRDSSRSFVPSQVLKIESHTQRHQSQQHITRRGYESQNIWFWYGSDIWSTRIQSQHQKSCWHIVSKEVTRNKEKIVWSDFNWVYLCCM